MTGATERFGAAVLDRLGGARSEELGGIADRVATLLVAIIRLVAIPAGGLLMLEGGASVVAMVAVGLGATTVVVASTAVQFRRPGGLRAVCGIVGDGAILVGAMELSGGIDSPVRLLLVVQPIASGLLLDQRWVLALGVGTVGALTLLDGPGTPVLALAAMLAWGVALGMALARRRRAGTGKLERTDALRRSVLGDAARRERELLGAELRDAGLEPLLDVADRLPRAARPELAALAHAVVDATARLRSVVVELHVLTARQGGLEGSLEALARRRSPDAVVLVDVRERFGPEEVVLLAGLARDALGVVADADAARVELRAGRGPGGAIELAVRATPTPRRHDAARRLVLDEHLAQAGARCTPDVGGLPGVRLILEDEADTAAAPGWIPGRTLEDSRRLVAIARVPSILAVAAVALLVGGTEGAFWWSILVLMLWAPMVSRYSTDPRLTFGAWVALSTPDLVALTVMAQSAGAAQESILPILVGIAPAYAVVIGPRLTGALGLVFGVAMIGVAGLDGTAFVIASAWSLVVALILATGVAVLESSVTGLARDRRNLVRRLAADHERDRRAIAAYIHDDTLQVLLAARQDIEEAAEGGPGAEDSRRLAIDAVQNAIAGLHRVAGDLAEEEGARAMPGGLHAALGALAGDVVARGGPELTWTLAPDAVGHLDGLVLRLARELVINAVTHAEARSIRLAIDRAGGDVVVTVADDGRGADLARVRDAVARGHIGLASCRERVAVSGGSLVVGPGAPRGTVARAVLPVRPA